LLANDKFISARLCVANQLIKLFFIVSSHSIIKIIDTDG
ncbi:MAG: hypothetical protein ACJAUM_002667, partial [Pseudomonadales bacterium]